LPFRGYITSSVSQYAGYTSGSFKASPYLTRTATSVEMFIKIKQNCDRSRADRNRRREGCYSGRSESLKVMYFGVSGKATRDYNVGAEDVVFESPENPCFQLLHSRLMPSVHGIRANIRINLCQNLESLGNIFVADSMVLSSFKFSWWASKDTRVLKQSALWPVKVIQGR